MRNLTTILTRLYGNDRGLSLDDRIRKHLTELPRSMSFQKEPNWHKNLNFYIVYPDGIEGDSPIPLHNLRDHLDWVKDLGCNAVHVLPFLDSPMIDKGFDISNFYTVRPDLGELNDLLAVQDRARELGLQVFMDLVFNHVSDQHEWFRKAEEGDEYYRNYFFWTTEKPKFIRRIHTEYGVMAEYEIDGELKQVYIVFPETAGEIPHWRQGKDGNWYYHTFYPQQLDINWFNPDVFFEFVKIITHWASFGFHFRLDAIPFVGKGIYKDFANDDTNTHLIVQALYELTRLINPNCSLLVESYEHLDGITRYFGTTNQPEATMAYNFHLCTNLWLSLIRKDVSPFAAIARTTQAVPVHAEWINFLRNHDELSIAFIDEASQREIVNSLIPLGAPFRGGHAIAGRTFSLLGNDPKRHLMAYTLLASIPGTLGIPYGDELGMENVPLNDIPEADRIDTRNINRGVLSIRKRNDQESLRICSKMQEIIKTRRFHSYYLNVRPEIVDMSDNQVFAISYSYGISELLMVINISEQEKKLKRSFTNGETMLTVNEASFSGDTIKLGPYGCIWLQR
ncbi:MAG: alpha-amylase family glycosyl hydrolase [Patescibacteria group bacterium]|nr:alpha-amylase family glycosyl hydrolase [Patescibacteria group bacterium]